MEQTGERLSARPRALRWALVLALAVLFLIWLDKTPSGLLGKADALGYAVCHRIAARSFLVNGRPLPLCARCTGMYLGALVGLTYQYLIARRRTAMPSRGAIAVLAVLALAFGVDGLNSYLHLFPNAPGVYEPQNWLRLLTGSGMGVVLSAGLFPAFNQTVWIDWDPRPALDGLRSLGGLLLITLVVDGLVLTENPVVLYPFALLSAASVLIVLAMVYLIVLLIAFKRDNRFVRMRELVFPALAGLLLALLQVGVLDLARFWLTGTWNGFLLG